MVQLPFVFKYHNVEWQIWQEVMHKLKGANNYFNIPFTANSSDTEVCNCQSEYQQMLGKVHLNWYFVFILTI